MNGCACRKGTEYMLTVYDECHVQRCSASPRHMLVLCRKATETAGQVEASAVTPFAWQQVCSLDGSRPLMSGLCSQPAHCSLWCSTASASSCCLLLLRFLEAALFDKCTAAISCTTTAEGGWWLQPDFRRHRKGGRPGTAQCWCLQLHRELDVCRAIAAQHVQVHVAVISLM